MIAVKHRGNFNKIEKFLNDVNRIDYIQLLDKYGHKGVAALASATPVDSGLTANSWNYEIKKHRNSIVISWTNSNVVNGVPIAIILQNGHATQNGGYVQGRDYINPAIQPIFDNMANEIWREVRTL